jgi:predicted metal-dependent enzyme (double-stranded beta helix superfamily)
VIDRNHAAVVDGLGATIRGVCVSHERPVDRIEALQAPIAEAVRDAYWLAAPFCRVQGRGSYYLLWRDRETDVALVAMVLGPGDETPIHDHLAWGVVGVYAAAQYETRYIDRQGTLRETVAAPRLPGSVTHLLPPDDDIHYVRNQSDGVAISVFVMGSNLGCRSRHEYLLDGTVNEIVSGYANAPCPGQTRSPFFVSQFM